MVIDPGKLFIISAPSGAGKTTLCRRLLETMPDMKFSVSCTTRGPRPGEVHGIDYTFVDEARFRKMIEAGEFAEWAEVHGSLYGTSEEKLRQILGGGTDVILDIDVQGAKKIMEAVKGGVYIFILPPSMDALEERLHKRLSNSPDEIKDRLGRARDEIKDYGMYDYVIVNDTFEKALKELQEIVLSKRGQLPPAAGQRAGATRGQRPPAIRSVAPSWVERNFLTEEEG